MVVEAEDQADNGVDANVQNFDVFPGYEGCGFNGDFYLDGHFVRFPVTEGA